MELTLDIETDFDREKALKYSMLHFRGVAFPKFNDMIFRRRLILRNSNVLRRTLENVRDNLLSRFNDLYDFNNAELRRDMLLLFLTPEELSSRLSFEVRNLPMNQDTLLSENYALILQLKKIEKKNPKVPSDYLMTSTSDLIRDRLREQFEFIKSRTEEVNEDWIKATIKQDGVRLGFKFFAPNEKSAGYLLEDLKETLQVDSIDSKRMSVYAGFRALDFMPKDPVLDTDEFQAKERDLVQSIYRNYSVAPGVGKISVLEKIEREELVKDVEEDVAEDVDLPEQES